MNRLLVLLLVSGVHAQDYSSALQHARQVNLERAERLPNFVADEIALRYHKGKGDKDWRVLDRIESEIAVRGGQGFTRQDVRLNDRRWDKPFPDFGWSVAFGDELRALFDPTCPTVIEFEKQEGWEGKPAAEYRFHSAPNACFKTFAAGGRLFFLAPKRLNPVRHGRFVVDDKANLVRAEIEAIDFPKDFGNDIWMETTEYNYVLIGDQSYLLPVTFDLEIGSSTGQRWKAHVVYSNHRHFEASTNLKFDPSTK